MERLAPALLERLLRFGRLGRVLWLRQRNAGAIAARNPNLNFSAALMPQLQGNVVHLTFGKLNGLALSVHLAANSKGALSVAQALTGQSAVGAQIVATGLPPVRSATWWPTLRPMRRSRCLCSRAFIFARLA